MSAIQPAIRSALQPAIRSAILSYGAVAWSPLTLFAASEVGVWYDPSDFSTMFQDSAGATPVTAVGDPVGLILDKSAGLVLGPDLVTNGDFSAGLTGWTGASYTASGGVVTQTGISSLTQVAVVQSGTWYRVSIDVTEVTASGGCSFQLGGVNGAQFSVTTTGTVTQYLLATVTGSLSFVHRGSATFRGSLDNFSCKVLLGNHASQATAASRPILRNDGTNYYLEFDGVDDSLATAAIDFTATDEVSLFAGVRKLNDTAAQVIIELSASMSANAGAFLLVVKNTATQLWASGCRGTTAMASDQFGYSTQAAPDTAVITSLHDISGDLSTFRRNGVAATSGVYDKGTGNFGNYALYIGRRGGTTLPFNGRIYSLTILGRTATALEIAAAEAYVASKTGVTL